MSAEFHTYPAPAKLNLTLHVTGRRADGYHLLDSLVVFCDLGDVVTLAEGPLALTVTGPFAAGLAAEPDNLCLRAARLAGRQVSIALEKNLPVASGIGGGSADAAAALRGLLRLWRADVPKATFDTLALGLGADVPMCLAGRPLIARGIGEDITPVFVPALAVVIANPLVGVSTPAVFKALASRHNPPLALAAAPADWLDAIGRLRNDLEPPARVLCPDIAVLTEKLAATDARVVRMSGSGATCFALYRSDEAAEAAAAMLSEQHPHWFFTATRTLGADDGTH